MRLAPIAPAVDQPPGRVLDRWRTGRSANHIAEGELVTVTPFSRGVQPTRGHGVGAPEIGGGYRFGGGIATAHRGVEVLVEHGGEHPSNVLMDTIRGYIDTLGAGEVKLLTQVEVLAQPCPQDAYWRDRYGIPGYFVRALTGGGVTQLWRGSVRTMRVFHHEQAHLLDFSGSIPRGAWGKAVEEDDRGLKALTVDGWKLSDLPIDRFDFERDHLRLVPGGITGYAEFARTNASTLVEDIAESVAWRKLGRRVGPIARATNADGRVRDMAFEELFPARARLVDSALQRVNGGS